MTLHATKVRQLHPDWPAVDPTVTSNWDHRAPLNDLAEALEQARLAERVPFGGQISAPLGLAHLASVTRYSVSYHGTKWEPPADGDFGDDYGSTELDMVLYGQLIDGRWYSVHAGNDYTGWGCQDFSEIRVADTEDEIIRFGLDKSQRAELGVSTPEDGGPGVD